MTLEERLKSAYVGAGGIDPVVVERTVRRRRTCRRATVVGLVGVLVLAGVVGVRLLDDDGPDELATRGPADQDAGPPDRGLIPVETGLTLVFDDGMSGLVAVDVDEGLARRQSYGQKSSGIQDVRLARVGDRIVWPGRPDAWAVPASLDRDAVSDPVSLGEGSVIVPAGDGQAVWLIAGGEGDSPRLGPPLEATLVDGTGAVVIAATPFPADTGGPEGGNRQGLWLPPADGIGEAEAEYRFWSPELGFTDWRSSIGCGSGGAGGHLVLRGPQRPRLLTDPEEPAGCVDLTTVRVDGTDEVVYDSSAVGEAVFSDDQELVALRSSRAATVYETSSGEQVARIDAPANPAPRSGPYWSTTRVAWAPDGEWLVTAAERSAPVRTESRVSLGFLNVVTGASYETTVVLGSIGQFVVLRSEDGPTLDRSSRPPRCDATDRDTVWPAIQDVTCIVGGNQAEADPGAGTPAGSIAAYDPVIEVTPAELAPGEPIEVSVPAGYADDAANDPPDVCVVVTDGPAPTEVCDPLASSLVTAGRTDQESGRTVWTAELPGSVFTPTGYRDCSEEAVTCRFVLTRADRSLGASSPLRFDAPALPPDTTLEITAADAPGEFVVVPAGLVPDPGWLEVREADPERAAATPAFLVSVCSFRPGEPTEGPFGEDLWSQSVGSRLSNNCGGGSIEIAIDPDSPDEATTLRLDSSEFFGSEGWTNCDTSGCFVIVRRSTIDEVGPGGVLYGNEEMVAAALLPPNDFPLRPRPGLTIIEPPPYAPGQVLTVEVTDPPAGIDPLIGQCQVDRPWACSYRILEEFEPGRFLFEVLPAARVACVDDKSCYLELDAKGEGRPPFAVTPLPVVE